MVCIHSTAGVGGASFGSPESFRLSKARQQEIDDRVRRIQNERDRRANERIARAQKKAAEAEKRRLERVALAEKKRAEREARNTAQNGDGGIAGDMVVQPANNVTPYSDEQHAPMFGELRACALNHVSLHEHCGTQRLPALTLGAVSSHVPCTRHGRGAVHHARSASVAVVTRTATGGRLWYAMSLHTPLTRFSKNPHVGSAAVCILGCVAND